MTVAGGETTANRADLGCGLMSQSWEKLTQGSLIKLQTHNADLNSTPITVSLRFLHFSWKNIFHVMFGFCILLVYCFYAVLILLHYLFYSQQSHYPYFWSIFLPFQNQLSIICHRSYGLGAGLKKKLVLVSTQVKRSFMAVP